MTALLRRTFLSQVAALAGCEVTRIRTTGSHSLVEAGPDGPLLLLRAGTLDRERRLTTAVRGVDLQALAARPTAAVAFLADAFEPVVVPFDVLRSHLDLARERRVLHVALASDGALTLRETGHDLRDYCGAAALERLFPAPLGPGTPSLSHADAQTLAATYGCLRGYQVHVPAANRTQMVTALAAGADPTTWAVLPPTAARIRTLKQADVVLTRPGEDWPRVLVEIEHGGNIDDALARSARTLATLQRAGAPWLPRVVIVAAGRRRQEVQDKAAEALYQNVGLTALCDFWSYDVLWTAVRWWRQRRRVRTRRRQRLARVGGRP